MPDNSPNENSPTGINPYKNREFEHYVTWRALGGLIIDEDNPTTPNHNKIVTLNDFCEMFNVDRKTIYNWKTQTPDLAARIEKRRNEIVPLARVSAVWNQLYLTALQTKDRRAAVDAQKAFLGHYGNLQLPTQRTEVDAGQNLLDLVNNARKKKIIEGQVVDRPTADA